MVRHGNDTLSKEQFCDGTQVVERELNDFATLTLSIFVIQHIWFWAP